MSENVKYEELSTILRYAGRDLQNKRNTKFGRSTQGRKLYYLEKSDRQMVDNNVPNLNNEPQTVTGLNEPLASEPWVYPKPHNNVRLVQEAHESALLEENKYDMPVEGISTKLNSKQQQKMTYEQWLESVVGKKLNKGYDNPERLHAKAIEP